MVRGVGWLIIFIAAIAVYMTVYVGFILVVPSIALDIYPLVVGRDALVRALHPFWIGVTFLGAFVVAGFLTWGAGKKYDPDGSESRLLFMPFRAWAFIYPAIGLLGLGVSLVPNIGLVATHYEFVSACERGDPQTGEEGCSCLAGAMEELSPMSYVPFYDSLMSAWQRPAFGAYEVEHFLKVYDESMPAKDRATFKLALNKGTACIVQARRKHGPLR